MGVQVYDVSIDPRPCRHNKAKKGEGNGEQHQQIKKKPLSFSSIEHRPHQIETSNPVKTNPLFGRVSLFFRFVTLSLCMCVCVWISFCDGRAAFAFKSGANTSIGSTRTDSQAPIFDAERRGPCVMYIPPPHLFTCAGATRGSARSSSPLIFHPNKKTDLNVRGSFTVYIARVSFICGILPIYFGCHTLSAAGGCP